MKAVFLDKDGTLIEDVPFNVDPERIRLYDDVAEGLRRLQDLGYALFVISNQPGVALGYFTEERLAGVARFLREELSKEGVTITDFLFCTHHPSGRVPAHARRCSCRKPAPGLLLKAADTHGVTLGESWCIGDILDDVEAGRRAGCRSILIDNGHETEWVRGRLRTPDFRSRSLQNAVAYIAASERGRRTASG